MSDIQRTGNFTAVAHLQPGVEAIQLQALFHQIGTRIQEATNDGRTYKYEVKIVTNVTVEPWDAEIGEYVHHDRFVPTHAHKNVIFEPPDGTPNYTFKPTYQGYQRIE